MNILFLLRSVGFGGVEVVSVALANMLARRGHRVSIFAREYRKNSIADRLSENIRVYYGCGDNGCKKNVQALHEAYEKENIHVVVNQWGLPFMPIRLARNAEKGHAVRVISFYHNDPSINGMINSVELKIKKCNNPVNKFLLGFKKRIYRYVTSTSMRYTYTHSDVFVVLSDCYLKNLQRFIRRPFENKQRVLINPITIDKGNFIYQPSEKKKEIIFCGRLDNIQKCPIRVLDVWSILSQKYPQWVLRFVGDGPDKGNLEKNVRQRQLKNVYFEGFQDPKEYYQKASILVMTSDFEGFPLVLVECMSFGVVPCVYDSFAAVHDVVENGKNGIIVDKDEQDGFAASKMEKCLESILDDAEKRNEMALAAIETSKRYAVDAVYKQWEGVLASLS